MKIQSSKKFAINIIVGAIWGTLLISVVSALLFIFSRDFRFFLEGNKAYSYDVYSRTWILAYHGIYQIWWWGILLGAIGGVAYSFIKDKELTFLNWQALLKIWLHFAAPFLLVFLFLGLLSGGRWLGVGIGFAWGISISVLTTVFWSVVFTSIHSKLPNRHLRIIAGIIMGFVISFLVSTMIRSEWMLSIVLYSGYLGAISTAILLIFSPQLLISEPETA